MDIFTESAIYQSTNYCGINQQLEVKGEYFSDPLGRKGFSFSKYESKINEKTDESKISEI